MQVVHAVELEHDAQFEPQALQAFAVVRKYPVLQVVHVVVSAHTLQLAMHALHTVPLSLYPSIHDVAAVALVHCWAPVPHAAQSKAVPNLAYPAMHALQVVAMVHWAQLFNDPALVDSIARRMMATRNMIVVKYTTASKCWRKRSQLLR
jgi:hypothetical protein